MKTTDVANGDIVVHRCQQGAIPAFAVRAVPGPDQLGCATRAKADELARSYAEHAGVDAWFQDSTNAVTLLARFRHAEGKARRGSPVAAPLAATSHR